jgi:hypothetical protein
VRLVTEGLLDVLRGQRECIDFQGFYYERGHYYLQEIPHAWDKLKLLQLDARDANNTHRIVVCPPQHI